MHLLQASGGAWQPYKALEVLFVISGGLTIAYMTKLYICLFWEKHPTRQAEFDAMNGKYLTKQSAVALLGSAVLLPLLGALPQLLMSPMGARSAAFFGPEAIAAPIHYFSLENLTGALQSIVIGAATYLLIVRPMLMRREDGAKVYVDRWPARLDLENSVYRPLLALLTVLATGVTRFVAELPERVIVLMRGNVFRKLQARKPVPVGNRFTYKVGCMMNSVTAALNNTFLQQHPLRTDFEYVLDAAWQAVASGLRRFTASVSFGLLLLCIGLFLTCVYLLRY